MILSASLALNVILFTLILVIYHQQQPAVVVDHLSNNNNNHVNNNNNNINNHNLVMLNSRKGEGEDGYGLLALQRKLMGSKGGMDFIHGDVRINHTMLSWEEKRKIFNSNSRVDGTKKPKILLS